jgi:prepilin-type processing-associated H-X9-DG protein
MFARPAKADIFLQATRYFSPCRAAQISSRHNAGANINFADGHVAYFKYSYFGSTFY